MTDLVGSVLAVEQDVISIGDCGAAGVMADIDPAPYKRYGVGCRPFLPSASGVMLMANMNLKVEKSVLIQQIPMVTSSSHVEEPNPVAIPLRSGKYSEISQSDNLPCHGGRPFPQTSDRPSPMGLNNQSSQVNWRLFVIQSCTRTNERQKG